ncbi:MAG: ankyrin repeat domain-containing protein [Candidatus Anstonellales archaeon]
MKEERRLSEEEVFRRVLESVRSRKEDEEAFEELRRINRERREEIGEEKARVLGKELIEKCEEKSPSIERVVKLILEGADVNFKDDMERTALYCTFGCGYINVECIKILVEAGADVNAKIHGGNSILYEMVGCCQPNPPEALEILLKAGACVDVGTPYNFTPLMHAVAFKSKPLVNLFIKYNANLFVVNASGKTAYDCACDNGDEEIKNILKDYMFALNKKIKNLVNEKKVWEKLNEKDKEFMENAIKFMLTKCDKMVADVIDILINS